MQRWAENVYDQHCCGMNYFEPQPPCDATQIGGFRHAIREEGLEMLLKATIETAVQARAIKPQELERVITNPTSKEKAIAHPTDSRLLEIARQKLARAAQRLGIKLKQTFEREGDALRRRASGSAHAKQFRRLNRVDLDDLKTKLRASGSSLSWLTKGYGCSFDRPTLSKRI